MRKLGCVLTAAAVAAALVAIAAQPSDAAGAFDGLWSVSISTSQGPCSTYRYPARIVGGRVTQAEPDFTYQLAGFVNGGGSIVVTVSSGGQSATGRGHLNRTRGAGYWAATGGQCRGTWSAERRG